jgi:glutathione S-transferase
MDNYKLTYFNGRGRAEIIRLVLTAAGVPFEDNRIEFDQFANIKPTLPFLQLPIFEIDGKVTLCQSHTIARYLARKYGLAGKDDLEQAQADMIVDCFDDASKPIIVFFRLEPDPVKKEELKKKYIEEQLPVFLSKLEKLLIANKGGDGYFVGDGLTWADLNLVRAQGTLELMAGAPDALKAYPKLNALFERVIKLPKIAAYIDKRPVTPF